MACKCSKALCRHVTREYDRTVAALHEASRAHDRLKKAFSAKKFANDFPGLPITNENLERQIRLMRGQAKA